MPDDSDVVIAGACRTPIGAFMGTLGEVSSVQLAALTIAEALRRAGLRPEEVDEVIVGSVLTAGLGQNVARQAAIAAGLPVTIPAETLNMVCGSGMKSVIHGVQAIRCGDADVVVACGTGEHVQRGACASRSAQGAQAGPRRSARQHDFGWADRRVQRPPHGHHRREYRRAATASRGRMRTDLRAPARTGPKPPSEADDSAMRSRPSISPRKRAAPLPLNGTNIPAPELPWKRSRDSRPHSSLMAS